LCPVPFWAPRPAAQGAPKGRALRFLAGLWPPQGLSRASQGLAVRAGGQSNPPLSVGFWFFWPSHACWGGSSGPNPSKRLLAPGLAQARLGSARP
jgi:hypothetical protein